MRLSCDHSVRNKIMNFKESERSYGTLGPGAYGHKGHSFLSAQ